MGYNQVNKHSHQGVPEGERKKGKESLFKEKLAEKFLNVGRNVDIRVYKDQRTSSKINSQKINMGSIVFRILKIKDKDFESSS